MPLCGQKFSSYVIFTNISDDEWEFLFKILDLKTPMDEDICQNNYSY